MGKKSKLVALVAGASLLLGTFGLTACVPENDDKTGNKVPEDIYAIYTAYAETAGDDAMTYDEWYAHLLETAKGDKGDKGDDGAQGKSAYDIWKENGHSGTEAEFLEWLKGGKGDDGKSAYDIWKEQDGNAGKTEAEFLEWLKGDKGDKGDDGDVGPKGEAGTKWFTGEDDEPSADLGAEGDFYLNTKTFDLWTKKDSGWTKLGCIKGADGTSDSKPSADVVHDFGQMTLSANVAKPLDLAEVKDGTYYLVFETASEAKSKTLIAEIGYSEEYADFPQNYDMYMPISAKYQCVFIKNGDISTLSLKSSEEITGTAKLMQYTIPTITAGVEIEAPCVRKDWTYLPINIDSSFIGHKVKIEVKSIYVEAISLLKNDEKHTGYGNMVQDDSDKTLFTLTTTIPDGETAICLSSSKIDKNDNVIIKITLAD